MARRKLKPTEGRKKRATPRRRPLRRSARGATPSALARARARITELEAENRRLREELALTRGGPLAGRTPDRDDGPLAPGM